MCDGLREDPQPRRGAALILGQKVRRTPRPAERDRYVNAILAYISLERNWKPLRTGKGTEADRGLASLIPSRG